MTNRLVKCGHCARKRKIEEAEAENVERAKRDEPPLDVPNRVSKTCRRLTAGQSSEGLACFPVRPYSYKHQKDASAAAAPKLAGASAGSAAAETLASVAPQLSEEAAKTVIMVLDPVTGEKRPWHTSKGSLEQFFSSAPKKQAGKGPLCPPFINIVTRFLQR